jgi:hypothetical protein
MAATRGFSSSFRVPGNLVSRLVLGRGQDKMRWARGSNLGTVPALIIEMLM